MNIGLVLSGGGVRGVAHIGAIKALEEAGIYPTHISGTSAGAIVGSLYAAGVSWSEILNFFKETPIFKTNKFAFNKPGFIDTEKLSVHFNNYFSEDDFSCLIKPLYVAATNLITGELKIFSSGELINAVLASASFPGVFTPVKIKDSYYIDGGILNNFPIEPLKMHCDAIIGVYVNPLKTVKVKDLKHSYSVLDRAYKIMEASRSISKFADCDLVLSPKELTNYGTFNMKSIDQIFDLGYNYTKAQINKNQPIINSLLNL